MEIKIQLTEQELLWLHEIAENQQMHANDAIKKMIKEQHEQLTMDIAFELYQPKDISINEPPGSRSARKAALKNSLIEKARGEIQ